MQGDKSHVGMMQCFYCTKEYAVALQTNFKVSHGVPVGKLPKVACYNMDPCPTCQQVMDNGGLILIGTTTSQDDIDRQRAAFLIEYTKAANRKGVAWAERHPLERQFVPHIHRLGTVYLTKKAKGFVGLDGYSFWAFIDTETWNYLGFGELEPGAFVELDHADSRS